MSVNAKALTLAYNCVVRLGWNHSKMRDAYGISLPTLRRVRKGAMGKVSTDEYCMGVFISILHDEYIKDLNRSGGDKSSFFNKAFKEILFAEHEVGK